MKENKPDVSAFDERLARAYTQTENKQQQYDDWAASYDSDLIDDMDYVAYKDAGDIFFDVVPDKAVRILDVACGTGLAGQYMREHDYHNIDGADFSENMLAIAWERNIYQSVWQHDFTKRKELSQLYDALICVGMFSFAGPKISDMHNVVNCVKPGGDCVITVNGAAWEQLRLEGEVYREAERHRFSIERIATADYIRKEGIDSRVLIIKR